jgi:hypothetical protein
VDRYVVVQLFSPATAIVPVRINTNYVEKRGLR